MRAGGSWAPHGAKLTPTDASDEFAFFGGAVALSADATTLLLGGTGESSGNGAAWLFAPADAPLALPTLSVSPGSANTPDSIWDNADLFDGDAPTGSLTFSLYGPNAEDCSGPPAATLTVPVSGNDFYDTGGRLTVDTIGTYLDVVTYSGDARNAARSTVCGESELSVRLRPTLAIIAEGTHEVGATLRIVPTLQGGSSPSGTLELRLSGPTDPDCNAPLMTWTLPVTAGRAEAVEYVPPTDGIHRLEAFYSGDDANIWADVFCDDASAQIVIARARPVLTVVPSAAAVVGDPIAATAHVTGGGDPTGSVRFVLFPPSGVGCGGAPAVVVSAALDRGSAASGAFATTTAGMYRFVAAYGDDARNQQAQTACDTATVAVAKRRPRLRTSGRGGASRAADGTGTIAERAIVSDGYKPTGSIAFKLYGPRDPDCRRAPAFTSVQPLVQLDARRAFHRPTPRPEGAVSTGT